METARLARCVMLNMEDGLLFLSVEPWKTCWGCERRCRGHAPSSAPSVPYLTGGAAEAVVLQAVTLWGVSERN